MERCLWASLGSQLELRCYNHVTYIMWHTLLSTTINNTHPPNQMLYLSRDKFTIIPFARTAAAVLLPVASASQLLTTWSLCLRGSFVSLNPNESESSGVEISFIPKIWARPFEINWVWIWRPASAPWLLQGSRLGSTSWRSCAHAAFIHRVWDTRKFSTTSWLGGGGGGGGSSRPNRWPPPGASLLHQVSSPWDVVPLRQRKHAWIRLGFHPVPSAEWNLHWMSWMKQFSRHIIRHLPCTWCKQQHWRAGSCFSTSWYVTPTGLWEL